MERETPKLVLASASEVRATILGGAGINFDICPSQVDEGLLKGTLTSGPDLALALAAEKARAVAAKYSDHLVLGADQILSCDGKLFDKPRDVDEARGNLLFLRGKTHQLINGMVLALNDELIWQNTTTASLTMRKFSDAFWICICHVPVQAFYHLLAVTVLRRRAVSCLKKLTVIISPY